MRSLPALLALLALAACDTLIPVEVTDEPPRLVVEALFQADSLLTVEIGQSASVFGEVSSDDVETATVEIWIDGALARTAPYVERRSRYVSDVRPRAGQRVTLRASAPGFEPVEAEDVVPHPVPLEVVSVEGEGSGDRVDVVTVRFEDPPGADRYALFGLAVRTFPGRPDDTQRFPVSFRSAEPALADGFLADLLGDATAPFYLRAFFRDTPFEGTAVTLRLEVRRTVIDGDPLPLAESLRLARLSPTYYAYVRALEAEDTGPFGDPVRLPSNVRGGYGVFAAFATAEVALP